MVLGVERGPQNPTDQLCIFDNEDRHYHDVNDDDKHNIIVIVIMTNSDQSTCGGEVGVVEFVMIPAAGGGAA